MVCRPYASFDRYKGRDLRARRKTTTFQQRTPSRVLTEIGILPAFFPQIINPTIMLRDAKYLIAYTLPLSALLAVQLGGWWTYATVLYAFALLPVADQWWPRDLSNHAPETEPDRSGRRFFDYLLYLNVPMLYAIYGYAFWRIGQGDYAAYELIGLVLSLGVFGGASGINVAHELNHRSSRFERLLAKFLLLPTLYLHFTVEHNLGHHRHVATPLDPATSRYGESVYAFWWRSVTGSWRSAWQLEAKRSEGAVFQNRIGHFAVLQLVYLGLIALFLGPLAALCALLIGVVAFLNLETVNYIEHYGLTRNQTATGRYEPVQPHHSWNSDHELGRIVLYELTRHSDHHFRAARKYQILRRFEESPQLPQGYPASMLMALVPPLWFRVMDARVAPFRNVVA